MRIGLGYDVHRLVKGRDLILGGVLIPHEKGLLGHSDADVLVHALCDALLGAAGMGDIGRHFPDTDPAYEGIDSLQLLARTAGMVRENGFALVNADATLFAQAPKMAPYHRQMVRNIAAVLETPPGRINIKATTTEGLGMIGSGDGIAAMAVVLLEATR